MGLYEQDAQRGLREPGIGRLARVAIVENGDPMVRLDSERLGRRVFIQAKLPWVRVAVADMLTQALASLPEPLTLRISTAYRTLQMQRRGYERYMRQLAREHPEWPRAILVRQSNRFFHPVTSKAPPGHCTGGAVDVALVRSRTGTLLDHTSTTVSVPNSWPTFCPVLTDTARANRAVLYEAMRAAGFSNCFDEWWHWSYGDSGWAARLGHRHAVYGLVTEYPPEMEEEILRKRPSGIRRRDIRPSLEGNR
ncbi:MAG TPA: M15 family metallopeptidase [Armatimonadota bacterium]|nr:M15 family metallopeptidase [Armatimonadota bacterium]HQK94546.1 M15 family metallopeptidase [Armatimonadota bacterium]